MYLTISKPVNSLIHVTKLHVAPKPALHPFHSYVINQSCFKTVYSDCIFMGIFKQTALQSFLTSLCGVLVFGCVHNSPTKLTRRHNLLTHNLLTYTQLTHTQLTHTQFTHTHNLLTHHLLKHNLPTHTHNLPTHNLPTHHLLTYTYHLLTRNLPTLYLLTHNLPRTTWFALIAGDAADFCVERRGRPSLCVASVAFLTSFGTGLALVARWSRVTLRTFAWQAWHLVTSSTIWRGRRWEAP